MSTTEPTLLHLAEERSQSREQNMKEVWVIVIKCAFKALGVSALWGTVATGGRLLFGDHVSVLSAVLTYGVIWILYFGVKVPDDMERHDESLCSERRAETYQPVQPQPEPIAAHPPILVHPPGKREPYLLTEPEMPGRETLRLTPPVIAEILQGVIERYDGSWSRRKLTRLRIAGGQKVSRSVYEQLTAWLHKSGVLEQTAQGGFQLLAQDLDDLHQIFPGLPVSETGQAGGEPGNQAGNGFDDAQNTDGEVVTLAERRKARWLECNRDIEAYLER